jgi:hypothetical protein
MDSISYPQVERDATGYRVPSAGPHKRSEFTAASGAQKLKTPPASEDTDGVFHTFSGFAAALHLAA